MKGFNWFGWSLAFAASACAVVAAYLQFGAPSAFAAASTALTGLAGIAGWNRAGQ